MINLIASTVAGVLWTAASLRVAFIFLAAAMAIAAVLILTTRHQPAPPPPGPDSLTVPARACPVSPQWCYFAAFLAGAQIREGSRRVKAGEAIAQRRPQGRA